MDVYESCPVLRSARYTLRLVSRKDAPGLLAVYGDERAAAYFNADNCTSDFRYATLPEMLSCIDFWLREYSQRYYVRWTILEGEVPIGTVELFHRESQDAFNHHALLRLDLRPDRETVDTITELGELLCQHAYNLFGTPAMATKIWPHAAARREALSSLGFTPSCSKVIGHNNVEYGDYWVRQGPCPWTPVRALP